MLQHIYECEKFTYECEKLWKYKQTAIYVNKQLFVYIFPLIYPILKLYLNSNHVTIHIWMLKNYKKSKQTAIDVNKQLFVYIFS